jgi:hypothetical protein
MQAELYGKHGLKSSQVPATPQSSLSGILGKELAMFGKDMKSLVSAKLEEKGATRPCSRSFGSTEIKMNSYQGSE